MPELTLPEILRQAIEHHEAGRLPQAEALYRKVLAHDATCVEALHFLGVIAHQVGRHEVAIDLITRAAALAPSDPAIHSNLGEVSRHLRRFDEASASFKRALALRPDYPDALNNLGSVFVAQGRLDEALTCFQRALALTPEYTIAHYNLGNLYKKRGRLDDAVACFQRALALEPSFAEAHNNLGDLLKGQGHLDQAHDSFQRALTLKPDFAEAHNNLGNLFRERGEFDQAIASIRQALVHQPDLADAHNNLGTALTAVGRSDEALACFRQALALEPNFALAHYNLGNLFTERGQLDDALECFERALALKPDLPEAHNNLGNLLKEQGQFDDALACFRRALALKPDYAEAHNNLGSVLRDRGELDAALASCQRALALRPDFGEAHNNLGGVFKERGQLADAIACFRQSLAQKPDYAKAHSNIILTLHYHAGHEAGTIEAEHRRWNRQHAAPLAEFTQPHPNERSPDRRLRIGYVSPDFRRHPVGFNLLPLFQHHTHGPFEIFCYAQVPVPDDLTARLRACSDCWHDVAPLDDAALADLIRRDQIDILVDLALHTAKNRLLVFARKPAPIQVSFAGYPAGTGLDAIDYHLTDPYLEPAAPDAAPGPDAPFHLPDTFWCYDPQAADQPVGPLPALAAGRVTFGSLNNFCKINDAVLRLWARVLLAVPASRLMLLTAEGTHRQHVLEMFAQAGVEPDRIEIRGRQPRESYFALYHRIDLGLDTFPYNGHTTSLDSYWMGVPVVTLVGPTGVGRAGLSQLTNLGLAELAASTPDDFVQIATALARDLPRLAVLRAGLRERMQRSPLMDAPRFARNVEAAYRTMWHRWCGQPVAGTQARPANSSAPVVIPEALRRAMGHLKAGRLPEAEALYREILAQDPNCADALHFTGVIAHQNGRHQAAVELIGRAAILTPENPAIHSNLGEACRHLNRLDEAVESFRRALALRPNYPDALSNMGNALVSQGRLDEGIDCFQRALAFKPDFASAHNNLGTALTAAGRLDEAVGSFQQAVALQPDLAEAHSNLGTAFKDLGQLDETLACYRRALALKPNQAYFHSNLILALHYHFGQEVGAIETEHRHWNQQHARPLSRFVRSHRNDRSPDRRLRIGYVSPDLRQHPVGRNVLPLFQQQAHDQFEIFCYADVPVPDDLTEKFRACSDCWHDTAALSTTELTELVRKDQIDILVDLALHTADNRLLAFARKPAPVQVSFAGYPGGSGLETIDYHLTDPHLDPPGGRKSGPDAPFDLPDSFWCYDPQPTDPGVNPLPALASGHVTFGCLNNFCKVNDAVLVLWARVLLAVPSSHLLLLAPENSQRQRVFDRLGRAGVSPDRIAFVGRESREEYLGFYQRIDLGLDTFPYNGHTTSLDSYWMGVPVITLVDQTPVGRAGWSQLSNLGLTELAAHSPDDFVRIAAALARDLPRLAALRAGLRERMQRSPLMDASRFARAIEAAYRTMWRRWCAPSTTASVPIR